jgi:uncharacterized protein YndB with AHSA1/START domain
MNKPDFVYVTYIETTAEAVWHALTDSKFTRAYWGGRRIQSDWQPGSSVQNVREDGGIDWDGEVLLAEPPHLLSYTFHMKIREAHQFNAPSKVTFEIEQIGAVVKLTLSQEFAPGAVAVPTTQNGWAAILSSLKSFLEREVALPFTDLGFGPSDRGRQ